MHLSTCEEAKISTLIMPPKQTHPLLCIIHPLSFIISTVFPHIHPESLLLTPPIAPFEGSPIRHFLLSLPVFLPLSPLPFIPSHLVHIYSFSVEHVVVETACVFIVSGSFKNAVAICGVILPLPFICSPVRPGHLAGAVTEATEKLAGVSGA